jgi:hypothetical protein
LKHANQIFQDEADHSSSFFLLSFFLTKPKLNSQIISNNFYSSKTHSADEISGSESDESIADDPTAAQSVGFPNNSASQEIFELQRLEDIGLCELIDDT